MKKFAFAVVFAVVAVAVPLAASCGGGPSCKQYTCDPVCARGKICNGADFTCVDPKTCSATCDTGKYCDGVSGTCKDIPTTCSPVCASGKYCNTLKTPAVCEDVPVCKDVCKTGFTCQN